ncbi:hypothetical protein VCUG_01913, partial [Vavraia culicis subsp. floridensis]
MKQLRKRLEALSEIFESEKSYVQDLKIWGEDFKRYLFQSETLTVEKKHSLSKTLFINLDAIIALHEQIIRELGRRNEYIREMNGISTGDVCKPIVVTDESAQMFKDLEYHSVYYKYLNRFGVYRYYVSRLPTVEFDLDKECNMNRFFKQELMEFFNKRNIELGPKHFIYRASQKLARYAILWNAVLHYEENPSFIEGINTTVQKLKEIAKDVDQTYGSINESYKIFRFSADLHYAESVKNRIPLNLFQKQRKILKEGDVIIKYRHIREPKMLRFIVLDTVILICDVVKQGNVEIKYIITDPLPLFKYIVTERNIGYTFDNEYLESMNPLFLLERAGTDIVVIFFKDERIKRMYFDVIHAAMEEVRKYFKPGVNLCPLLEKTNYEILCCSTRDLKFSIGNEEDKRSSHGTVSIGDLSIDDNKDSYIDGSAPPEVMSGTDKEGMGSKEGVGSKMDRVQGKADGERSKEEMGSKTDRVQGSTGDKTDGIGNDKTDGKERNDGERSKELKNEGMGRNSILSDALSVKKNENRSKGVEEETKNGCKRCVSPVSEKNEEDEDRIERDEDRKERDEDRSDHSDENSGGRDELNATVSKNSKTVNSTGKTEDGAANSGTGVSDEKSLSRRQEKSHSVTEEHNMSQRKLRFATQLNSNESTESTSSSSASIEQGQRRVSFFKRMLGHKQPEEINDHTFSIDRGDYRRIFHADEQFLLFGTKEGLFKKIGPHFVSLHDKGVHKVVYDVANKIIVFLESSKICCAPFVPSQDTLHTKLITRSADDFFYGITLNKLTIASLTVSNNSTTSVSLFKVTIENRSVSVVMDRKLFVGCLVFDIAFFNTKLVIACRDFEMVDSDTLKTQELVDPLDLCVPFYFKGLKNVTALSVFTIDNDVFLVCYDSMGFFIDSYGRTIRQNIIFVWYVRPLKFMIYKEYLACVSEQEVVVWDINTANMVFYMRQEHLRFVTGSSTLLLYDQYSLYKLTLE